MYFLVTVVFLGGGGVGLVQRGPMTRFQDFLEDVPVHEAVGGVAGRLGRAAVVAELVALLGVVGTDTAADGVGDFSGAGQRDVSCQGNGVLLCQDSQLFHGWQKSLVQDMVSDEGPVAWSRKSP